MTRSRKTPDPHHPATEPAGLAKTLAPDDVAVSPVATRGDEQSDSNRDQPPSTGSRIGRFLLLDKLGEGGMGVVFAARDEQLDRKIAIKLLLPGLTKGRERLLREARALARLTHPNVVTVHDVGTLGDRVYVAMEFVEGATLTQWLEKKPSWPEILQVFLQAADGLAAAHDAGIVHRDFKPDNVLVGSDGRVRVLDFGLAKGGEPSRDSAMDREALDAGALLDERNLTRTGAMMGTPAYMAPEQFLGGDIDARTDQFAFCVALYEGLHGARPFTGSSVGELARAVTEGAILSPPTKAAIPPALGQALARGLSTQREQRFPTMHALRSELARATREPGRRSPRRWPIALAFGAVLGLGGLGLWSMRPPGDESPSARSIIPADDARAIERPPLQVPLPPLAPSKTRRPPKPRPPSPKANSKPLPPDSPGSAAAVAGGEGSSVPLPSVTDCPPYHPPPRAPESAQRQLKLLTNLMATNPPQGEALLQTLGSLVEHHQRNDDEAAACAVAQRFLALTPNDHPGRWDMMCLERQLDCRNRFGRARALGAEQWSAATEAQAPDATFDETEQQRRIREALDGLREACRMGHALSCLHASDLLGQADSVVYDQAQALAQTERGCRLGELAACATLRRP